MNPLKKPNFTFCCYFSPLSMFHSICSVLEKVMSQSFSNWIHQLKKNGSNITEQNAKSLWNLVFLIKKEVSKRLPFSKLHCRRILVHKVVQIDLAVVFERHVHHRLQMVCHVDLWIKSKQFIEIRHHWNHRVQSFLQWQKRFNWNGFCHEIPYKKFTSAMIIVLKVGFLVEDDEIEIDYHAFINPWLKWMLMNRLISFGAKKWSFFSFWCVWCDLEVKNKSRKWKK